MAIQPSASERKLDKALEDSFPASDPPANSGITGADPTDKPSHRRTIEERPAGTPTSDRHATKTVHRREGKEVPPEDQSS